jgi:hypothetical protein
MLVDNIRLELQMEIKQRYVVSYIHRNGMKLPAIIAEIAVVYHGNAFDENKVKYWLHEIKLHRSDLSDQPSSGRLHLEDIDFSEQFEKNPQSRQLKISLKRQTLSSCNLGIKIPKDVHRMRNANRVQRTKAGFCNCDPS